MRGFGLLTPSGGIEVTAPEEPRSPLAEPGKTATEGETQNRSTSTCARSARMESIGSARRPRAPGYRDRAEVRNVESKLGCKAFEKRSPVARRKNALVGAS